MFMLHNCLKECKSQNVPYQSDFALVTLLNEPPRKSEAHRHHFFLAYSSAGWLRPGWPWLHVCSRCPHSPGPVDPRACSPHGEGGYIGGRPGAHARVCHCSNAISQVRSPDRAGKQGEDVPVLKGREEGMTLCKTTIYHKPVCM